MDLKFIRDFFLNEKAEKILTLLAFILFLSSFLESIIPPVLQDIPNFYRLGFGLSLTFLFVYLFFSESFRTKYTQINKLKNGVDLKLSDLQIKIVVGVIQDDFINDGLNSAIILPANSSLDNQCLNDEKSSLGSYVLRRIPEKKELFFTEINNIRQRNKNMNFPIGSSFLLNENYSKENKIIVTCVSQIVEQKGVTSNPENISICVGKVFELASVNKIKHLIMPVIGSGHGTISVSNALHLIIYSAMFYSKEFTQIKKLTVVVHESNRDIIEKHICIFNSITKK